MNETSAPNSRLLSNLGNCKGVQLINKADFGDVKQFGRDVRAW